MHVSFETARWLIAGFWVANAAGRLGAATSKRMCYQPHRGLYQYCGLKAATVLLGSVGGCVGVLSLLLLIVDAGLGSSMGVGVWWDTLTPKHPKPRALRNASPPVPDHPDSSVVRV